jgi:hypothetical protein
LNSTEEYWSLNGVSLHQFGWSVATVGGSRYDLPPRRGGNTTYAYRPGQVHRGKLADSRTITLLMWVTGTDPGTGAPTGDTTLAFNDSWDFLRRLVWKPGGAQVTLTRRWFLTVGGVKTLVVADAQAEIADAMTPTMTGRARADFSMNLLLADPYFYGPQVSVELASGQSATVDNPGHDLAGHAGLQVDLIGGTNPRLTNATPAPPVWVQYTGSPGGTLTLDTGRFTANRASDGANLIGGVSHGGARHWMALLPGANQLSLTGGGSAQLRFRPPYV